MNTDRVPKILVTSLSKKVPLIRELQKALSKISTQGRIIGADIDKFCIGSYFVDDFWEMPSTSDLSDDALIAVINQFQITGIIPTRDAELLYFSSKRKLLEDIGVHLMLSNEQTVNICLDKLLFTETLKQSNFSVIESSLDVEQLKSERFVVKERYGAGSIGMAIAVTKQQAIAYAKKLKHPMFQPFIEGDEFSVDVFFNKQSQCMGVIPRKREVIIHGESQVTSTLEDTVMENLCQSIGESLGLTGHGVFQLIKTKHNKYKVIELNSRFGGASTLSIAAGLDSLFWFVLESIGESLDTYPMKRTKKQLKQVRYAMDKIVEI